MKTIIVPGDGDHRHGTYNGYGNLRCGWSPDKPRKACQPCKDAHAEYHLNYMDHHPEQRTKQAKRTRDYRRKIKLQLPNEPENHTIVGWGDIINGARVRIDEYVDALDDHRDRWYDISDDTLRDPISWEFLVKTARAKNDQLYILEKTEL